jgi:hypothetical protein
VSATAGKEKKKGGRGPLRLRGKWAGGPLGQKGKEVSLFSLSFCFSNSFQINLLNSNSNQKSSNFSQNFINFLDFTQATKNHAKPNNDAQSVIVSRLIKLN